MAEPKHVLMKFGVRVIIIVTFIFFIDTFIQQGCRKKYQNGQLKMFTFTNIDTNIYIKSHP